MTLLLENITICYLLAELDDVTRAEAKARHRFIARTEAELHRQTAMNPYLVDQDRCPAWHRWPDPNGLFGVPAGAHRHGDGLLALVDSPAARELHATTGWPDRRLSGWPCTYHPERPHPKGCVCRGLGIARPVRPGLLPGDAQWMRLAEHLTP